ncbi:MAG TPA: phosphoribosylanthranilate isomerase, partial [Planctomycetota bacterium]|nr:phosphoribosylanthranilate isomerase [Planctomycetota bacterium]
MISVKICGITSLEDAQMCVQAGARALGFVFYGLSPRAISLAAARDICRAVPANIKKVGVFVNASKESVLEDVRSVGLDMAQLSGDELVTDCQWLTRHGVRVVKAVRPKTARDVAKLADYREHVFAFNIDAFKEGSYGGTGTVAEWALARQAKQFERPVILAGGLNGGNVVSAVRAVDPSALDVCSGVEREPGKKDAKKLKGLFEALWRLDEEVRKAGGAPIGGVPASGKITTGAFSLQQGIAPDSPPPPPAAPRAAPRPVAVVG